MIDTDKVKQLIQEYKQFSLELRIAQKLVNEGYTSIKFHEEILKVKHNLDPWTNNVYICLRDIENNCVICQDVYVKPSTKKFKKRLNELANELQ